ncbi:MAG: ABC transporter ATP-binding protein [Candidatus Eremiobacteraeota bacterium]|nr:ABC transporter ATP-binding protein [Candidatus Eremiobacteraeota bacterium]
MIGNDAIVVDNVSKRFRLVTIPKQASFKETIIKMEFLKRKHREERYVDAVRHVSFRVPHGSTLGLIGRNGSGKTTMMRLLAGVYKPDAGSIAISGEIAPLLSLGVGFHPDMTGRENVKINGLVLGLSPKEIESKYDEIVDFSELNDFIDVPVRTYSSGMYMRLAFSIAVSVDPDVLLLDEILSVGDESFASKCLARMRAFKQQGKTIVLVTHDTNTLQTWCDSAVWMDRGAMRMYGGAAEVVDAYHRELHAPTEQPVLAV